MSGGVPHAPVRLTVYARSYCHLCEEMIEALEPFRARYGFEIATVDVDSTPELEAQYGEWVPVLVHEGHRICHYRLDEAALTAHLDAFR